MSDVRLRTISFLLTERDRLLNELDEVQLLLDLLDAGAEPAPVEPEPERPKGMRGVEADNQRKILDALANGHARLTVNEIAARVKMPASTVQGHLRALYEAGRIDRRIRQASDAGGRAPYVYELVLTVEQREHTLDLKTRLVDE